MTKVDDAKAWLAELLAEGPARQADVMRLAVEGGFSVKTMERASRALDVHKSKVGRPGEAGQGWTWELGVFGAGGDGLHGDAFELLASLTLESGARWGEVADAVQVEDARTVLDPHCATPYHFETRSRGRAKTSDAAACGIVILLTQAPPQSRSYYLAADRDQGRLAIDSVSGYMARTPGLAGHLEVEQWKATARASGASLEVLAADAPSSYGLRPYFLVIDELSVWAETEGPKKLFDAVTSSLTKTPGARCLAITSAGSPSHWSYRVLEHARRDPLWRTHEVPGPAPWIDSARLAEQKRRLLPSVYERLFENTWCEGEDVLATRADVEACVGHSGDLAPEASHRYVAALDVGLVHDRCVAVIAHSEERPAGRTVVVDRLAVWAGRKVAPVDLSAVEAWVEEACRAYRRAPLVYDPFQAAHLTQRLKRRGVRLEEFTFSQPSVGKLAVTIYGLLKDHCLDLPDHEPLIDEFCAVKLRETGPNMVRLDHAASGHDDMVISVALCAQRLVENASTGRAGSPYTELSGPLGAPIPIPGSAADHLVPTYNPLTDRTRP